MEAILSNLALRMILTQTQYWDESSFRELSSNVCSLADLMVNLHMHYNIKTIVADIVNEVCCNFPFVAVDYSQEPMLRT